MLGYGKTSPTFDPKRQPAESIETYRVPIGSDVDPTAMLVEFAATGDGDQPDVSTSWVPGAWSDDEWANDTAFAFTPLIGKAGGSNVAIGLEAGTVVDLWWRVTTGDGAVVIRRFDQILLVE